MRLRQASALSILVACLATPVFAQTGYRSLQCSVGAGFACAGLVATDDRSAEPRRWIRVLVIWKGGDSSGALRATRDTTAARAIYRRYLEERRAAEDRERTILGGASGGEYWIATLTRGFGRVGPDSLFVLDQPFEVPATDSAIVVLVDGVHSITHTPRVVGSARMVSAMPPQAREKRWVSGDTTFIVSPRATDGAVPMQLKRSIIL